MPKIHTLTTDTEITGTDKLLGSDGATGAGNATKNYLVSSLKAYIDTTYTAGDGLDLSSEEFAVDSTVVRTTGDQTLAGVKTFSGSIVGDVTGDLTGDVTGDLTGTVTGNVTGNLTGNVTGDVTGNVTGDLTGDVTGDVTGNLTGPVVGNVTGNLTGNVTGNVTGDVTGDLTGNADTVTNGVYTTGDQTIAGFKTFSNDVRSTGYSFSTTLGKVKEAKVTVSSVNLTALNGGGNYTLIAAAGNKRAIVPISITIKSDPGATQFNFNQDLYIGIENEVSSTSEDYFASVGASFINNATILFRHFPFSKATNEHVNIRVNEPLVLHATSGATVTAGDGELVVNVVYREVDFS